MSRPDDPKPVDVVKPDPVLSLLTQILERLDQLVADQVQRLDEQLDTIRVIVASPPKERGYRTRRPNERGN